MKKIIMVVALAFSASSQVYTVDVGASSGFNFQGFNVSVKHSQDVGAWVVCGFIAAAIAAKAGYDVSWHNTYIGTVNSLYGTYKPMSVLSAVLFGEEREVNVDEVDSDAILQYEDWIHGSYNSWFTPWNWTKPQKNACRKISELAIMVLYADLLAWDEVELQDILNNAREKCALVSSYPLVYFGNKLAQHIVFMTGKDGLWLQALPKMHKILRTLKKSQDFITEAHTLQTHKMLQQVQAAAATR